MAETIYDGPPSPADNERALVEVAAERDQLRNQVEKLLDIADEMELAETPTGLPYALRRCLYQAADQVRKELEGR